jgi:hypothetical protein
MPLFTICGQARSTHSMISVWHIFLIGLIGSYFFARFATRRPADEAQWFYAERQADAMRSTATGLAGVGAAVRRRVIGPPGFRARVPVPGR